MAKYTKKALASTLALLIAAGTLTSLPALRAKADTAGTAADAGGTPSAVYLGSDTTTRGHWNGKYGGDGYILFGYRGQPCPHAGVNDPLAVIDPNFPGSGQGQFYTGNERKTSDLAKLPTYLSDYNFLWNDPNYYVTLGDYSHSGGDPNSNDGILDKPTDLPEGVDSGKYQVSATGGNVDADSNCETLYSFDLTDDAYHLLSFYAYDGYFDLFSSSGIKAEILDANNNVVASQQISKDTFTSGAYVTFLVKGAFRLRLTYSGDREWGHLGVFQINGFFFDSPISAAATGLTASVYQQSQAQLNWTNSGSPDSILIERSTDGVHFSQLAAVSGSTASYIDSTVVPGETYDYRVRYRLGTQYGLAADAAGPLTIPAYQTTQLTLQNADLNQTVGDAITLSAKLEQVGEGGNTPIAGETVSFKLLGDHVGDGTSLGQEIPADMGSVVTDENGVATVTYPCVYGGSFQVAASFAQDDERQLSRSTSAAVNLTAAETPWTSAPKIYQASDAVAPGQTFSINGYAIAPDSADVAIAPDNTGESPAAPPAEAIHPQIVQADVSTNFVVAKMPADAAPGVYNVWVKNAYGWSTPYELNAARALYMSDYQAFKGISIEVVGRNFDQKEFGGETATQARLNDGTGHTYPLVIKSLNPYNVTFTVGDQPLGNYFVEVSNDGGRNWSRLSSDQKLEVVAPGEDPLGLDVGWAKDFNWDNVYDVTKAPYNANPNDTADDRVAIQNAIDDAEKNGGGVVYLPDGSYYTGGLLLGADVVLEGQSENGTKLYFTGGISEDFIGTKGANCVGGIAQLQGVANLSLLLTNPDTRPDGFVSLGEWWGDATANQALRTANRIFTKNVYVDYPMTTGNGRGMGIGYIAKERTLIEGCHFSGWNATEQWLFVSDYVTLKDNYFEYATGATQSVAEYTFAEGNTLIGHPEFLIESHGLFLRSNAYAEDNTIKNMGNDRAGNEGEGICTDSPEMHVDTGVVLKADAASVTVGPNISVPDPIVLSEGILKLTITDGRGMGQTRMVTEVDQAAHKITVDKPFDVSPDSTSKFALYVPNEGLTVYHNTTDNVLNGVLVWWGGSDDVIAGNNLVDSYGIYVVGVLTAGFDCPSYYTRITGNTVVGVDRLNKYTGIGVTTQRGNNGSYFGVQAYATDIRNNTIIGDNTATDHKAIGNQYPAVNGIYLTAYGYGGANGNCDGTGTGDITNSIIENNKLSNLTTGVTLTKCDYGQVVSNNRYDNSILNFLNTEGGDNTLVTGNTLVDRAPSFTRTAGQTAVVGQALGFTLQAADPDHDALTYSASNLPKGAALDSATGAFSWTPTRSQAGSYVLHLTVSDGTLSDSEDIAIAVVDKTQLEAEIRAAGRLDEKTYTADSWAALQTALTQAGGVDGNTSATQIEVNSASRALKAAIARLKLRATVTGVTVSPSRASVRKGSTQDFRAAVRGTGNPSQAVTWAVSGNRSGGTSIDSHGRLTVAADETASALTVTATSTADGSKSGTASVQIKPAPCRFDGWQGVHLPSFLSFAFQAIWNFR